MILIFFRLSLKVLELFQCRRGNSTVSLVMKWQDIPLVRKISQFFNGESCHHWSYSGCKYKNWLRFFELLKETLQIYEFATTLTSNISNLEDRPWISKVPRMSFLVRLGSWTYLRPIRWYFFLPFFQIIEKFMEKHWNVFCSTDKDWQNSSL